MDHAVGAGEVRNEIVGRHVGFGPLRLRQVERRSAPGQAEDGLDPVVLDESLNQTGPDVPGRPRDNYAH
jgi:hypothetical protein